MGIEVSDIALECGTVLQNRYRIEEIYYLGQIGIVYFAVDLQLREEVVIKEFMPYSIANRDMDGKTVICRSRACEIKYHKAKENFMAECEYVERIRTIKKPYEGCVLEYLDSFQENGTQYLITKKINGKSLQDYIESGETFSVRKTMQMLVSIVRHIHKKGIIHCDVKPSNIILREDGRVALIDFGSACNKKDKTRDLFFVSRGYSAPELYHGTEIDQRTDIYSIGAVLYYMLTDSQLPEPDDYDENEEIPRISEYIEISQHLEKAIFRMINRDKKKRPRSLLLLQFILSI